MPQLLGMAVWGILDAFGQQKPREFIEKNRMNLEKMEDVDWINQNMGVI